MPGRSDSDLTAARRLPDGRTTKPARILVAEDEFLLACSLEENLRLHGFSVIGPFSSVARATEAARNETFDVAVLDVNLKGEMIYPLADELQSRGFPILFLSGYGWMSLPERFRSTPRLSKPCDPTQLVSVIEQILAQ